jgi:uncharacterized protein
MTSDRSQTVRDAREVDAVVPTAVGNLAAVLCIPVGRDRVPGVVLVDGSGDGDRSTWGGWPEWIADAGSAVLRHDKPGCGGSPGHWSEQTLEDRAHEALAAARVLRADPACAGEPVGLYGFSQGGWVALIAAVLAPDLVDFVVCHCGPATSPADQERERMRAQLLADGFDGAELAEAMAWVVERESALLAGAPVEDVLARQSDHAGRPWLGSVTTAYSTAAELRFLRGILGFDPAAVIERLTCPVMVLYGGADELVPALPNAAALAAHLPPDPRHGVHVFPGADHGLFTGGPEPGVDRRTQLAPGYLPALSAFLADRSR